MPDSKLSPLTFLALEVLVGDKVLVIVVVADLVVVNVLVGPRVPVIVGWLRRYPCTMQSSIRTSR